MTRSDEKRMRQRGAQQNIQINSFNTVGRQVFANKFTRCQQRCLSCEVMHIEIRVKWSLKAANIVENFSELKIGSYFVVKLEQRCASMQNIVCDATIFDLLESFVENKPLETRGMARREKRTAIPIAFCHLVFS